MRISDEDEVDDNWVMIIIVIVTMVMIMMDDDDGDDDIDDYFSVKDDGYDGTDGDDSDGENENEIDLIYNLRYSGGVNWRQKIDTQRGAVLATELKNNSCRLARWTAQSLLAGADLMKLGR